MRDNDYKLVATPEMMSDVKSKLEINAIITKLEEEFKSYTGKEYSKTKAGDEIFYDEYAVLLSIKIDTLKELFEEK